MSEEDAVISVIGPVVAVVVATIAIWGAVRFFNRPRKPGWRFWDAVSLIVAVVYPLSYGPALWLVYSFKTPAWLGRYFSMFYEPLHWIAGISQPTFDLYFWYSSLWVTPGPHIVPPQPRRCGNRTQKDSAAEFTTIGLIAVIVAFSDSQLRGLSASPTEC